MGIFTAAAIQMRSTMDPQRNAADFEALVREAAGKGARFVQSPEMTGAMVRDPEARRKIFRKEEDDLIAAAAMRLAAELGIHLHVGSTAILRDDGKVANRALLVSPKGAVLARYDKIHMFDVDVSETETYRESAGFRPGDRAVTAQTAFATLGLTVCYDIRFPHLYRALAKAGARILTVPAAFSQPTGKAHWETLLRARAIETGCFVLAPAQTGDHPQQDDKTRRTHGHSMAVAPWGEVLADAGTEPGVTIVDLDLDQVTKARHRVPALTHDRPFEGPS